MNYYKLTGPNSGLVIGYCTSETIAKIKQNVPTAIPEEITKEAWEAALYPGGDLRYVAEVSNAPVGVVRVKGHYRPECKLPLPWTKEQKDALSNVLDSMIVLVKEVPTEQLLRILNDAKKNVSAQ